MQSIVVVCSVCCCTVLFHSSFVSYPGGGTLLAKAATLWYCLLGCLIIWSLVYLRNRKKRKGTLLYTLCVLSSFSFKHYACPCLVGVVWNWSLYLFVWEFQQYVRIDVELTHDVSSVMPLNNCYSSSFSGSCVWVLACLDICSGAFGFADGRAEHFLLGEMVKPLLQPSPQNA